MTEPLSLHEAADELGVHYMTAYRYVRHGLLAAVKVSGSWQVEPEAIERFRSGDDQAPVEPGDRAPWSERMETRLVAGDAAGAWGIAESALASGADLETLYLEVISPAMVSIGARWAAGELDIAIEHQASGIVTRMMGRLGHRFVPRGRTRGGVVVGAAAGESHSLPVAMLADLLRLRGWDVTDLGANVPGATFAYVVGHAADVTAVGISVTTPRCVAEVAPSCSAIHEARDDVKVIVGGPAITDADHARSLGADGYASNIDEMHALLAGWSEARRESQQRSPADVS